MYALISALPHDAMFWRVQEPQQENGSEPDEGPIKTNDPKEIRARLQQWGVID